jgi:hypothetical protein
MLAATAAVPLAGRGWRRLDLATFLAGAVLIDFDHYLGYVWETGDFSLLRAYRYHRDQYRRPRRWRFRPHWPPLGIHRMRVFHSVPVLAGVFALGLVWPRLRRVQDEAWGMFE